MKCVDACMIELRQRPECGGHMIIFQIPIRFCFSFLQRSKTTQKDETFSCSHVRVHSLHKPSQCKRRFRINLDIWLDGSYSAFRVECTVVCTGRIKLLRSTNRTLRCSRPLSRIRLGKITCIRTASARLATVLHNDLCLNTNTNYYSMAILGAFLFAFWARRRLAYSRRAWQHDDVVQLDELLPITPSLPIPLYTDLDPIQQSQAESHLFRLTNVLEMACYGATVHTGSVLAVFVVSSGAASQANHLARTLCGGPHDAVIAPLIRAFCYKACSSWRQRHTALHDGLGTVAEAY